MTNLRIMVTGRCNFSCIFCHMEGYKRGIEKEELTLDEIKLLKEAADRINITAFKITGGEPALRDDLAEIVRVLKEGGSYVSITTNASLIDRHLPAIAEAGIDHVNVSLHALSHEAFKRITGRDMLDKVIENMRLLHEYSIPVKINFVLLKDLNVSDINKVIDLAASIDAAVQFIELHPVGKAARNFHEHYLPRWRILEILEGRVTEIRYRRGLHNRPIIVLDNGVKVELVGPVGNFLFCAGCTRIRVTYDFKLIPCLNWEGEPIDVRASLSKAKTREEKVQAIIDAIRAANRLRRPYVMYPVDTRLEPPKPPRRIMRLGLPKSDGRLAFTGPRGEELAKRYLEEWGRYAPP